MVELAQYFHKRDSLNIVLVMQDFRQKNFGSFANILIRISQKIGNKVNKTLKY